ncbi:tetratricopeptide repeat protein [bacterium]|nr:tetratricopeptide repeat protein [bacterium]
MNRLFFIALLGVSIFTGCSEIGSDPTDNVSQLREIDARFHSGQIREVKIDLEMYLQEHPKSFRGWSLLGWAHLNSGNFESAKQCFDKSIAINAQSDNAYVGLGSMYRRQGDMAKARESYKRAIDILPDNPEAYSSLLVIELMDGNSEKAVEYGEKAWATRKNLASIPANLSVAYHYLGNTTKRDEFFQHAKRLNYKSLDTLKDIFEGKIDIRSN